MRRRPVKTTQMVTPSSPRSSKGKMAHHRPVVEWAKALIMCLAIITSFWIFISYRRSRHLLRKAANFSKLNRCDLSTYPLWEIQELKELNLSGCRLSKLPADDLLWSRFTSIEKIDLNNNTLVDLPNGMSALTSLDILFLSENKFEHIPAVVGKLSSLRVLSLRGNEVTVLSSTNLPTTTIVWLILTSNKISKIDPDIGKANLLRKLMLSHNKISTIPVEMGQCKDLELIRLADNNLSIMPVEVLTLPKLAWISLSGNPISKSPTNIKKIITDSDIEINESQVLGKGASGTVYKAKYNNKDVAVKIFKEQIKGSDGNAEDEAGINALIDHPLAMAAIGAMPLESTEQTTQKYKGMVMELVDGTYPLGTVPSFRTVTRDEGPAPQSTNMSKEQVLSVIWNVCSALEYIHSSVGVSHSDVYLHNILRDGQFIARLSDWGASFVYDRDSELAPIFERIEVLAFGHLVQDLFDWHLNIDVTNSKSLSLYDGLQNHLSKVWLHDLMNSILQPEQSKRPPFSKIKTSLSSIPEFTAAKISAEKLVSMRH